MKLGVAALLSVSAAALVLVGVQSQDKNYSVSKNVSDVVSSCWRTPVARAQGDGGDGGGDDASWAGNAVNTGVSGCDSWIYGDDDGGGDDGDACGDASSGGSPGCGPT
mgnify:CR=1 FL=1